MKNISQVILLSFLLTLCTGKLQAQEYSMTEKDTAIDMAHNLIYKLQPLLIGEIRISYEKVRATTVSNEYGIGYVYKAYLKGGGFFPSFDERNVFGVSIRMSQRNYTFEKQIAPFGFFHGPLFGYRFLVFEKDALKPSDSMRHVGRLYQNSLDLSYQIGWQSLLGDHVTMEIAGSLGGRVKYSRATGAEKLLENKIPGHHFMKDSDSILSGIPLPQLKLSVGYAF